MRHVCFDWPIYTEKDGEEIETIYEVEVEYSYDKGSYWEPGYEESILETVKLNGKEIPYKEWKALGFTDKEIKKIEKHAGEKTGEDARDAEEERGDQKYHEMKDDGRI